MKEDVRHIADIGVQDSGVLIEVQHTRSYPPEGGTRQEVTHKNMRWILYATHKKEAVQFLGRKCALIIVPRML